jgi:hypothetical protein
MSDDKEIFSDPKDIIPMTDRYDWRCFVNPKYGTWFLCKDGFPLRDSSDFNTDGWRVCAVEIGREKSIVKFAAEISALKGKLNEAREIIADMMPAALSGLMIDEPNTLAGYNDPRLFRARAFLKENENDAK